MEMGDRTTLKQHGVPFGARIVFRLQWAPFLAMSLLMVCTLPVVFIWGLLHDSAEDFADGLEEVLQKRLDQIKAHRTRLIRMYALGLSADQQKGGE
jgi:hypothetical protein